jgi:hypothetical protein
LSWPARPKPDASVREQAAALLVALNRKLTQTGRPALRPREMDLKFTRIGTSSSMSVPDGASAGDQSAVGAHGQLLYRQH